MQGQWLDAEDVGLINAMDEVQGRFLALDWVSGDVTS
jgi:hypothetical protein